MSTSIVFRREPTPQEVAAAQEEILRQQHEVDLLEQQIKALQIRISALRRDQIEHQRIANRCRGVITLARRIPPELLAKIFEHCVEDGWTRAPIVVSHVCSSWRKAAMHPRVWSHVYVDADSPDTLGRTRFWLHMARLAPLHIHIVASWHASETQVENCIELLRRHAAQWVSLKVSAGSFHMANFVRKQLTLPMPVLRIVDFHTEFRWDWEIAHDDSNVVEDFDFAETFAFHRAPRLQEVHLTTNVLPGALRLPDHLTSLRLSIQESPAARPLSASTLIDLLTTLPNLESLTLYLPLVYEGPFVEEEILEPALLPRLTALSIYGPTDLNRLLSHFQAPVLRRLQLRSLEDMGYRQEPIGPTLLQFLRNSQAPVELLELHDIDLSPEYFAACFAALPDLRTLRLHESSISDATVKLLTGPDALCPKLAQLDLRWCGHLRGKALVELVEDRNGVSEDGETAGMPGQGSTGRIEEVGVLNCAYVEEQDVLQLAKLTTCRVRLREHDYCRSRHCCDNERYRLRLFMRHLAGLSSEERNALRLIV